MTTDLAVMGIGLDTTPLEEGERALDDFGRRGGRTEGKVRTATQRMEAHFQRLASKVFNLRNAIGVLAGTTGIGLLVRNHMRAIDALAKFSDTVGETTENVQAFRRQAELAGIGVGAADNALQRASRRAAQAADGVGAASDAYERLGLSAAEISRLSPVEAFERQAEAIRGLTSRSDQLRAANELYGREAEDMIRIVDMGAGSFAAIKQEMEATGEAISRIDAARIEAANDAITKLQGAAGVLGQNLAIELAPYIEAIANRLTEAGVRGEDMGNAIVAAIDWAGRSAGFLADSIHGLKVALQGANVVALGFSSAAISAIELATNAFVVFADAVNGTINELIRGFNMLPGVEIPLIASLENEGWVQGIRELGEVSRAVLTEERAALHDAMMAPLPSTAVNGFMEQIKAAAAAYETPERTMPGMPSGEGGGEDDAVSENMRKQMEQRLEVMRQSLMTERELEQDNFFTKMEQLAQYREMELISASGHMELLAGLQIQHEEKLNEIRRSGWTEAQHIQADAQRAIEGGWNSSSQYVAGQLTAMTNGIAQHSRAAFEINKMASIAQAALNIPEAASNAYAWGAKFGGPVGGAAAATAAVAAQVAQMSAIQSTSFQGGGGGSAPSVSGSTPAPAVTPVSRQQEAPRQKIYVDFEDGAGSDDATMTKRELRNFIRRVKEENPDSDLVFG